ncbi:lengsin [Discoglossus pictus]
MDDEKNIIAKSSYTESDEIDGNILSGIRRKKSVKVSGKYMPPVGWEKPDLSHLAGPSNQPYFEKMYDVQNFMDSSLHTCENLPTKKEEKQISLNSNHREEISKTESVKRKIELEPAVVSGPKNMEDISHEKIKDGKINLQIQQMADKQYLPLGSAIPKETIEELKNILKDSPLIHSIKQCNTKQSGLTHVAIPKPYENVVEKSGLKFETFHLEKDKKESQSFKATEEKNSNTAIVEHVLTVPLQMQKEEQLAIETEETLPLIHDKASTSAGMQFESAEATGCPELRSSGIPNSLQMISLVEHIKQQIAKEDIHFVRFEAADLHGVSRSKTIPSRFFHEKAFSGVYMPRSYLELTINSKENEMDHVNASHFNTDIVLRPDLPTFSVLPWVEKTGRVICDSYTITNDPLLTSPRYLAKQLLNQLQECGLSINSAFTYEFCIFGVAEIINSKTIAFPAATLLTDNDHLFMQEVFDGMYYIGGSIESFSSSSGPGQMEVVFQPEYGLKSADNAFTFRTCIKEVAKKHGCIASFYTDSADYYNSGVLSHSLWDTDGSKNVFYSGSQAQELTDIGKKWLSGLICHSAALNCLAAPGVSCRKRFLKDGKESQEKNCATWGFNDNSCAYNIKCHGNRGTYIENKLSSATANPYLVLAATIAAGLDGIRRDLDFFDDTNSNFGLQLLKSSSIPLKMEDALTSLEEDKYMKTALGEDFIHYFVAMKKYELETEEMDSERNKFLEYFI